MTETRNSRPNGATTYYRSPEAQQLHHFICEYSFKSPDEKTADKNLQALKTHLDAVAAKNPQAMVKNLLSDMEKVLSKKDMHEQLLFSSNGHYNIFHTATRLDPKQRTPNPFVVDALVDAFYKHFDKDTARKHIEALYKEANAQGYVPYQNRQPGWLKNILALKGNIEGNDGLDPRDKTQRGISPIR